MKEINADEVMPSKDDWNAIQETLYLDSIPGMTDSIIEGMKASKEECFTEDQLDW